MRGYSSAVPTFPAAQSVDRLKRRVGWAIRDRFPNRRVVRNVQGVEMTLPWSHRLPDYTAGDSTYGQNLVELARLIEPADAPLVVIDVGANVGDSTLQILDATRDARFVCVEADDYYLDFLRTNVGADDRVRIEPALLVPDDSASSSVEVVRVGGTARFVEVDATAATVSSLTPAELRARNEWTEQLRLVKSDTDGYDVKLVPALATQFQDLAPVLFFEYDQRLSRIAGNNPTDVWGELEQLGYRHVAVWDNGGAPLGRVDIASAAAASAALDGPDAAARKAYWDVAVVHADDEAGLAAITKLVPGTL
jgi:FkbM family methyltransferase